jgi:hypothetical protein
MEFDQLFDELEQKFVEPSYDWQKQINCLEIQLLTKNSFNLLAPIIGVDFVAGLDKDSGDWHCIMFQCILIINPTQLSDDELPLLRKQEISFSDFLITLDRPVRVVAKYADQSDSAFNLLGVDHQFLITESRSLIPLTAIRQIRVLGTNSWA